ncbi:Nif3-like dinuclear metal center hexameric protein [Psychroflexus montanilacus]|uniref:Nif3-like dinuclear metal center hexameric protein n=1 Tax=Psychroflexus montanilacus TaxID=2873598 RepID=UPI001CCED0DC|nr:Nif3-like dinuclear metal center hexameric protein [Psychroflexus montanilacus]MBZ9653002.1 Nif3-like dinuclear metal center hexameric protein [Psychroflexus montanilacus]
MIVNDFIKAIEELSPSYYAEDFDNTGLLIGEKSMEVTGALITLDALESVVDEAIENRCNLIISFHPIVFSGLKKLNNKTYVERVVHKAIKHDIAIYAIHTALDNVSNGVNAMICEKLGLMNTSVLIPKPKTIKKLTTYVPKANVEEVRNALFEAGGGSIGNYDLCSFNIEGIGTFNGNENSNPRLGEPGKTQFEKEIQINLTFSAHLQSKILKALFESHPYEEVAYEVETLENNDQHRGIGMVGELEVPLGITEVLSYIKEVFKTKVIRHSELNDRPIHRIAVLGGSGAFAIDKAKAAKADLYITADLKYHDFYKAENQIILADIGHYESEQYTKDLIHAYLTKKFPNFALVLSNINTNPIQYY